MPDALQQQHEWWQTGIVYQVYPRSFLDTNNDGVGDLRGVMARLDYLKWLGVDAVWLSPIYPSPMADFGYDVSDYCGVHPLFGNLQDFDALVAAAHQRGLRVILDFVPNHTSDEHPWFLESRASRDNPKRDWFIWRDPGASGGPPNNWLSNFGGPAWTLDPATSQYYYHAFLGEQPDLNWRNPQVQQAMHDVLRFWLDRGVDGFRVDVIWYIVKDEQFRDNPRNPDYKPGQNPHHEFVATYTSDRPEVHDIIRGMRKVLDAYQERMLVGEVYLPVERLVTYYGEGGEGVHMPFNFQLITMRWDARSIQQAVNHYESSLPSYGWPNWVLGNHDNPRIASRIGQPQARVVAMLLLTLRGTPTLYYGDEIAMCDVPIPPELVQDPFEKNVPGMGLGRDPERTPMQWDASPNAGFTAEGVKPWLPIAGDCAHRNVAAQRQDSASMLNLYRRLIIVRRNEPALTVGSYTPFGDAHDAIVSFIRRHDGRRLLIALNLTNAPQSLPLNQPARLLLSTDPARADDAFRESIPLSPNEGLLLELDP